MLNLTSTQKTAILHPIIVFWLVSFPQNLTFTTCVTRYKEFKKKCFFRKGLQSLVRVLDCVKFQNLRMSRMLPVLLQSNAYLRSQKNECVCSAVRRPHRRFQWKLRVRDSLSFGHHLPYLRNRRSLSWGSWDLRLSGTFELRIASVTPPGSTWGCIMRL